MELQIIILTFAVVALGICYVFVSCESSRNKYRIRDLETEVEHLKDVVRTEEKFTTSIDDRVNGLVKRVDGLEYAIKIVMPPDDHRQIYCDGRNCLNPFHDCVGCPNQFGSGGTYTSTSVGTKSTDE